MERPPMTATVAPIPKRSWRVMRIGLGRVPGELDAARLCQPQFVDIRARLQPASFQGQILSRGAFPLGLAKDKAGAERVAQLLDDIVDRDNLAVTVGAVHVTPPWRAAPPCPLVALPAWRAI